MIRVTVEIVPGGDEARARQIGMLEIGNQSGLAAISDYAVRVTTQDENEKRVKVLGVYGHRRSDGFWPLVAMAASRAAPSSGGEVKEG